MKPTFGFRAGFAAMCIPAFILAGCADFGDAPPIGPDPPLVPPRPLTVTEKAVAGSGNAFGFKLFALMNKSATGSNIFISPLSVSMALGMTLNGANGGTREAMQGTLGFPGLAQDDINRSYSGLSAYLTQLDAQVQLQIANSIWYRPTLIVEQSFKNANMTYFNAEVNSLDFSSPSAPVTINNWISNKTYGRITNVVSGPIPQNLMMYLINAVYFKASWTYRYEASGTQSADFTLSDGSKTSCLMMGQKHEFPYFFSAGVQGADLPYGNGDYSMTVILPPPGVNIDDFVGSLTQEQWNTWIALLAKREIVIGMPKFRVTWDGEMKPALTSLGMGIAFSDTADFTGIDKRGNLSISSVFHATFVQVDEEGTEAAAVTVVGVGATASPSTMLVLNRPFVYAVRERYSGTILFMGKLAVPAW